MASKTTTFHFRIPRETLAELHKIAESHSPRVTVAELVRHLIERAVGQADAE
jgi:hypothetical protein